MTNVTALAYLGLRVPDLAAWRTFAVDLLGMQATPESDDTDLFLRLDDRSHRLHVTEGDPGLAHLGFEVDTPTELRALAEHLRASGVEVIDDPALAKVRRVHDLVRCDDPAGNRVELVCGHLGARTPFVSPRGVTFKTGTQGLGHVFMLVPDGDAANGFYVDGLGFRLSDTIDLGPIEGVFLHCNPRHHTLAYGAVPGVSALQHVMLEVDSLDAVGRAFDAVGDAGLTIARTIGMHTNDHMVSFYVTSPSGLDIEFGCNGREIDDDTWQVGHYDAASYWGHRRIPA